MVDYADERVAISVLKLSNLSAILDVQLQLIAGNIREQLLDSYCRTYRAFYKDRSKYFLSSG